MTQTEWGYCKNKSFWPCNWEVVYREKDNEGEKIVNKQWRFHTFCMTEKSAQKVARREARRSHIKIVSISCD